MNEELFAELRRLGVFEGPARDLARRYDGGDYLTQKVLTAFRGHLRETDNLGIAVWRIRNGIFRTGGQAADEFWLTEQRNRRHNR